MQKRIELLEEIIKFLSDLEAKVCFGLSTSENKTIINEKIYDLEKQLASLPKEQSVTDEDIALWANNDKKVLKSVFGISHAIYGAKAHRDGLIKK